MSNPEAEYHQLLDIINEAADQGDATNVLRIGDLAEPVYVKAVNQGYLPASNYRAGEAMTRTLGSASINQ